MQFLIFDEYKLPVPINRSTDKPINPVKTEIAFSFTKNPIYSFNSIVKKECKAISYF
jgi:hypothetical protein